MKVREELVHKINEDFWVAKLSQFAPDGANFIVDTSNGVTALQVTIDIDKEVVQKLSAISYGKSYNRFLFLVTATFLWIRRTTGFPGARVIATPALNCFENSPANGLLFMRHQPDNTLTVRNLIKQVHDEVQIIRDRADYDTEMLVERLKFSGINSFKWGIFYNMISTGNAELDHIDTVFSFIEDEKGGLSLKIASKTGLVSLKNAAQQIVAALDHIADDIDLPACKVNIVPETDKLLIDSLNKNISPEFTERLFLQHFADYVQSNPDRIALKAGDRSISYSELAMLSDKVAWHLINKNSVEPGEVVGLMIGLTEWRIIGILGILKAGAGYVPIKDNFPLNRIQFMLKDCGCKTLLTDDCFAHLAGEIDIHNTVYISSDISYNEHVSITYPDIPKHNCFVILYTSGSSGYPKGVFITHENITDRLIGEVQLYDLTSSICTIQTSNYAFDSSLLDIFLPFVLGGRIVVPSEEVLSDYERLADMIEHEGVTDLQGNPNFLKAFIEACIILGKKFDHSLQRIWSGGESLTQSLIDQIKGNYNHVMLSNHYGPTEGTVDAVVNKDIKQYAKNIIGKPIANMQVYICDEFLNLQPVNVDGEICISGKGLAKGYLNRPELTSEKFVAHPFLPGQTLYKTGDLGRLLSDGNIEYIGRIDDQIKIRGYRIELSEVENVICRYETLKEVVVLPQTDQEGLKCLVAYYVSTGEIDITALREFLKKEIPDFMIPSYFIELDSLPSTSVGKTDRKKLESIWLDQHNKSARDKGLHLPENPIEAVLLDIWKNVLKAAEISVNSNFFEIGGQSLRATQLIFQVYREFGVKLNLKDIFDCPTIKKLAACINVHAKSRFTSIPKAKPASHYEASNAQKRIWLTVQQGGLQTAYNMPDGYWLEGILDRHMFEKAFFALMARHESLRTTFFLSPDGIMQQIHDDISLFYSSFDYYDVSALNAEEQENILTEQVEQLLQQEFDLANGPLLKGVLIKTAPSKHLFLFSIHHIICDEWSLQVFVEEFLALYEQSGKLRQLPVQYKDYSEWKKESVDTYQQQEDFWLNVFSSPVQRLRLPYNREAFREFGKEEQLLANIPGDLTTGLRSFANQRESTLFITLLAAFNVFLYRICGQEDIVIGTTTSGRDNPELEYLIGFFSNTLALRSHPSGKKTFNHFLQEVKQHTLEAFLNQDFGFDELVKKLPSERSSGRNPLFDVLFEIQQAPVIDSGGFSIEPYEYPYNPVAKFDLAVAVTDYDDKITITWTYNNSLFERSTVRDMDRYFIHTLEAILTDPEATLESIRLPESKKTAYSKNEALTETQLFNFEM